MVYFGEHHYDKESGHAMGSWLDTGDTKKPQAQQSKDDIRYPVMEQVVEDIFTGFESMFSCWEKSMEIAADDNQEKNLKKPVQASWV